MKTIKLEVQIPEEAKYIAQDEDGEWWAFKKEPRKDTQDGGWLVNFDGDYLVKGIPNPNWRDTLIKVKDL